MIRTVSRVAILATVAVLVASAAMAGVPNAANSKQSDGGVTLGPAQTALNGFLILGGQNGSGTVDPHSEKWFLIKDAAGNPVNNSVVVLSFSSCYAGGDVRIASTQPFPGVTVNCGARTVSAVTNSSGIAVFRILGGAPLTSPTAFTTAGYSGACVSIAADGVPVGSMTVAEPDLNTAGGVGPAFQGVTGGDFSQFNASLTGGSPIGIQYYHDRINFSNADGAGHIGGPDLVFFNFFLTGIAVPSGSTTNAASYCP